MGKQSRWWGALLLFLLLGQLGLLATAAEPAGTAAAPEANEVPELRGAERALLPLILRDAEPSLPVVLVHGWQGGNVGLPCRRHEPAYVDQVWGYLDEYLGAGVTLEEPAGSGNQVHHAGLGFHVEIARLYSGGALSASGPGDPNWHCTPVVEENVPYLLEAIDAAKAATGQSRVILIGHSMGGLVSRAYLEGSGYRDDVAMLVTMGTPHVGVPVDVLQEWVSFITLGAITLDEYCQAQPAVCQFADDESDPDYPAGYTGIETFNAIYSTRAPGVRYHLLGSDAGFFDRNPFGNVMDAILVGPDDGIVPLASALGQSSMDGRLPPLSGPIDRHFLYPTLHTENFTDEPDCVPPDSPQRQYTFKGQDEWVDPCLGADYVNRYIPPSAYLSCLAPQLLNATPALACGDVTELTDSAGAVAPWARLPGHRGTLPAGETAAHTLLLGDGPAVVAVYGGPASTLPATFSVTMRDPAGRPVVAGDAVRVQKTSTATLFRLDAPRPGPYRLTITGAGSGAVRYVTTAAQESGLTLSWSAERPAYRSGERAAITATLSMPVATATVTGTVKIGEWAQPLLLAPAGGRRFTADFTLPPTSGPALLTLRAAGVSAAGHPFARELITLLPVADAGVALRGAPTTTVVPAAADAFADLHVVLPVTSDVARPARLAGVFVDGAGATVAATAVDATLRPGVQTVILPFRGRALADAAGPLRLAQVWIVDRGGQVLAAGTDLLTWDPVPLRQEMPPSLTATANGSVGPALSCTVDPAGPVAPGDTVQLTLTVDTAQRLDYALIDAPEGWTPSSPGAPPADVSGWQRPTAATLCPAGQTFWGLADPYLAPLGGICDLRADALPPAGTLHAPWAAAGERALLTQDFESAWPPAGWQPYVTAGNPNDGFLPTADAYSGAGAVRHAPQNVCLLCANPRSWLVSPRLTIRAGDDLLFWQQIDFPQQYDRRAIFVSVGSPDPRDGDFRQLVELGPASDSAWHQIRVSLDDYATRNDVYVAFYYEGDNADQWTIDHVRVARPELAPATYSFSVTYQVPADAATCGDGQAVLDRPVLAVARDDRLSPGTSTATCVPAQCAATAGR